MSRTMSNKLTRCNPFSAWSEMNDVFERIFDADFFVPERRAAMPMSTVSARSHSVSVDDIGLKIAIDLPGVKAGDLTATVTNNELLISAKRGDVTTTYRYLIHLDYDASPSSAVLADGVLTLTFNKNPLASVRHIEIKSS